MAVFVRKRPGAEARIIGAPVVGSQLPAGEQSHPDERRCKSLISQPLTGTTSARAKRRGR